MSVPLGADSAGHYHPILVDTTGRPLIVIDTLTGLTFTVTPDAAAEWTVKPKAGETWAPLQTTPANLTVGDHGYDGAAWRKQGLIWAYKGRLFERKSNLSAAAGANALTATPVPAGEVWKVEAITVYNSVSAVTGLSIYVTIEGAAIILAAVLATAAGLFLCWNGAITLKEDDVITGWYNGCTLNDDIYLEYCGYKMGIAM